MPTQKSSSAQKDMAALQVAVGPSLPPRGALWEGAVPLKMHPLKPRKRSLACPKAGHTRADPAPQIRTPTPRIQGGRDPLLSKGCEGCWWVLPLAVLTELAETA